jgi:hypothetical protein
MGDIPTVSGGVDLVARLRDQGSTLVGIDSANVDRRGVEVGISDPKKDGTSVRGQPDAAFS